MTTEGAGDWVRVDGLTKRYGAVSALSDVAFAIRSGEILGLIGPNGAGKTTLFECMAGVLPPTSGNISVNGQSLNVRRRAETLFYVPDAIAPWPSQTVGWVLDFTAGLFDGRRDVRGEVIEGLSLGPLMWSPLGTLSKGQRKRVLLAIGLLTSQPMLLADEPFDGLDLRQTREVAGILQTHAREGRTLFLSIHQIPDAARVCNRFVLLSSGRVCGVGTLDELSALARSKGATATTLEEVFLALT